MCAPVFPIYICVYNKYIIYIMYIWYIIYTYICIYWCSACAEAMCAPVFRSREQLLTQNAGKPGVVILGALQKLFFYFLFLFFFFLFFFQREQPMLIHAARAYCIAGCINFLFTRRAARWGRQPHRATHTWRPRLRLGKSLQLSSPQTTLNLYLSLTKPLKALCITN